MEGIKTRKMFVTFMMLIA